MNAVPPPQDRYQYKPFLGSSHRWALEQCEGISAATRVLDIGPGSGALGRELGSRTRCQLFAVEISAEARAHVASVYQEVHPTMEAFAGQKFDLVLMLDVLEHVADPAAFLRQATNLVSDGGRLLISVPNIAHITIRLSLAFGFFKYTSRGLLDRTHLQHFTRRRFLSMLRDNPDITITKESASIPPLEFVFPQFIWDNALFRALSRGHLQLARAWPGVFAYQHLAEVKKI